MNREDILQALDEISDARIEKTAQPPKRKVKKAYWYSGIAAVLAVAILLGIFLPGGKSPIGVIQADATAIATPVYPEKGINLEKVSSHMTVLSSFFDSAMGEFLQGDDNMAFSPMNLYMALAMLAETTDGQTREEIMTLLGAKNMDSLRAQAYQLWRKSYGDYENPCILANSAWLQKDIPYNDETMQTLAEYYFASVYENDFTAKGASKPIAQWIDQETGNMLQEQTAQLEFDPGTVMALVSTVYLQASWIYPFKEEMNTKEVFNGTKGSKECTFMNRPFSTNYYWGEDYTAVTLHLNSSYTMWFVLPNAGKTTADLLQSGAYSELFHSASANHKSVIVNFSMPKFDITCKQDMIEGLQNLGIKQVFQMGQADFTAAFPDMAKGVAVNKLEQATRVSVDEEGITAASYILCGLNGAAPPTEHMNFILDRPFLFAITNHADMPLFAGVVNHP